MPEGHTIHRLALDQASDLAGAPLQLASPQGETALAAAAPGATSAALEAAEAAQVLDGRVLEATEAWGKHLLHRYEGDLTLHVHLGLFGRFRKKRGPLGPPRPTCRLRLATLDGAVAWDLSGAIESKLLEPEEEAALKARLGPDPLRDDADRDAFERAVAGKRMAIGAALLDQSVVAGVGNVYRAEALFACGVEPHRPGRDLSEAERGALWETLVTQLRDGVRMRRIVTVPSEEAPKGGRSKLRRREAVQVYRRPTCRRCRGPVSSDETGRRTLWWCPRCQPA